MESLRQELSELTEGCGLLLDDRVYTHQSYLNLIVAIGCAKAVLAEENPSYDRLETAQLRLQEAVDALEVRQDAPLPQPAPKKKIKKTPVLVAGAFCGGLLLGRHLTKKRKKKT